jgi:hypothetical protein
VKYKERVARVNWGSYYALNARGAHLDRVHSDQVVLEMIRGRGWSLSSEAKSLKTSSKKTVKLESTQIRWFS